jgi:molybdenum cofactor cytidylyltransferase
VVIEPRPHRSRFSHVGVDRDVGSTTGRRNRAHVAHVRRVWFVIVRILAITPDVASADLPGGGVLCHDVRNPTRPSEVLARKGSRLGADAVAALLEQGISELHLALPAVDDLTEDEAANNLAAALAGPGVSTGTARYGQVSFSSSGRGMLYIDAAQLDRVNALDDVLLMTAEPERPVDAGTMLGVVKCAPLFLARQTVQAVEDLVARHGPVFEVAPFRARRVAFVAPGERLRARAFDQARAALARALEWYGASLDTVVAAEASIEGLADAYRVALDARVDLVLAAGAAGTDPLDVVFEGLRHAGGGVDQIGVPAEPGTACWIGHLPLPGPSPSVPVLGLASCELFGRPGALDLVLPRLLSGETLDRAFLRRLALGGLLLGPSRIAPYHAEVRGAD